MGLKRCDKCEEMVDEAKAFCPGCGASLVEEEGREATKFEKMDNTVQLGQTMYNQMLSDMGLGKEKGPSTPEKRVEIIEPVVSPALKPTRQADPLPRSGDSSKIKWIILGAAAVLVVGLIVLVAAGFLLYFFWPRIS